MEIWTKENIINYTSDPDEVNDKKYPKELQVARKSLREEDQGCKKEGFTFDWNYMLTRTELMGKETYYIIDYEDGADDAFFTCIKENLSSRGEVLRSIYLSQLEDCNPKGTISVATFFHEYYSTKKLYFYVASFTGFRMEYYFPHNEVYSLFAIQWEDDWELWKKCSICACSVISEQPQPPLHKEAANWMLKKIISEDNNYYDDFGKDLKDGKLEILI